MKLEELFETTHSSAVILITNKGIVVDSFYVKESFDTEIFRDNNGFN